MRNRPVPRLRTLPRSRLRQPLLQSSFSMQYSKCFYTRKIVPLTFRILNFISIVVLFVIYNTFLGTVGIFKLSLMIARDLAKRARSFLVLKGTKFLTKIDEQPFLLFYHSIKTTFLILENKAIFVFVEQKNSYHIQFKNQTRLYG